MNLPMLDLAGAVIAAYLLGAVPFGLLLSKLISGQDPRQHGSGNIGATNAMRAGGKLVGALTLLADIAKGALPVALAIIFRLPEAWIAAIAVATFVGHIFPVYLKFQGGKGVATMLGVMLPWQPLAALFGILIWITALKISHYVSLASILGALALPLLIACTNDSIPALLAGMLFASLVTIKHSSNIKRLIDGTESSTKSKQNVSS
ncbi:MAG: glycerol-3-phosphate 1-O-acyltransferase PlsY [Mariprofundus sp.]|nr:glycerol-3-phosphate 1-O-acyltransferase PlsY [Mariprofundus sp.]